MGSPNASLPSLGVYLQVEDLCLTFMLINMCKHLSSDTLMCTVVHRSFLASLVDAHLPIHLPPLVTL